ncbi:DHS-like NAD/FAD-binding domain-containing protein [Dipodascopsis uninucleata]
MEDDGDLTKQKEIIIEERQGTEIELEGASSESESEASAVSSNAFSLGTFFEDIVDGVGSDSDEEELSGDQKPSRDECLEVRSYLRKYGQQRFVERYLIGSEGGEPQFSIRALLYIFGVHLPPILNDFDEDDLAPLLSMAMARELSRRDRLPDVRTIDDVVRLIKESKNIVLVTGAGISTSLGIPDFRSDTGIYKKLEEMGLSEPQEVFDLSVFRDDPSIFYTFSKDILPEVKRFSPTHAFIKLLQDKTKLLTDYTQNIDNLEAYAGINRANLVQCHGSFAFATCQTCGHKVPGEDLFEDIRNGIVSRCRQVRSTPLERSQTPLKRKRTEDEDDDSQHGVGDKTSTSDLCNGIMKPDITFFGEALPKEFESRLLHHDIDLCDLLICIGTSLKVAPVSEIIRVMPQTVPQIYISRTPCTHAEFDVSLLGNCDDIVTYLCDRLGPDWKLIHEMVPLDGKFHGDVIETAPGVYKFITADEAALLTEKIYEGEAESTTNDTKLSEADNSPDPLYSETNTTLTTLTSGLAGSTTTTTPLIKDMKVD